MLYCTEKFHEVYLMINLKAQFHVAIHHVQLFDGDQYEEAALLAATSPMVSN